MILESVITCPHCATAKSETMPTDACQFFYTCTGCGATLRPKPGDCCVFCSYGSVPCPPIRPNSAWKAFGVIGPPRSVMKTCDDGSCSRCRRRSARISSPCIG
jgi:hypothetical protein